MKPPSRLLYLSSQKLLAYVWRAGFLVIEDEFEASVEGLYAFDSFLAERAESVFSLLVNLPSESFQREMIPFLRGKERANFISRRREQLFPNAVLSSYSSLGIQINTRKDERLLFLALTENTVFEQCLTAFKKSQTLLSGIYSLPILSAVLLKKSGLNKEECLFVSLQDQSLRQSFFSHGALEVSRFTPLLRTDLENTAQLLAQETRHFQHYLISQRLISHEQALTVYVLAEPVTIEAIGSTCVDEPNCRYLFLTPQHCAHQLGLANFPEEYACESLFLTLLALFPPRRQFADERLRHHYLLRKVRSALYFAGAFMAAASLFISAYCVYESSRLADETQALTRETADLQRDYSTLTQTLPALPTSVEATDAFLQGMNQYAALEKRAVSPEAVLIAISDALNETPELNLSSLVWMSAAAHATNARQAQELSADDALPAPIDTNIVDYAILRASLALMPSSTLRESIARVDHFIERLKSNPTLLVQIVQNPYAMESEKALKDDDIVREDTPRYLELKIARRTSP